MVHPAHGGGIGIDPRALVGLDRVRVPAAFPQLIGHVQEFVGAVVALVVRDLPGQPHGARRALQVAGDDVPAHAALGQVVQRGEAARQQIGRLVGQVYGDAKAQVARGRRHGRHDQQRVVDGQLDGFAQGQVGRVLVHVVHADDVGQEQAIEQAALQQPRKAGPVIQCLVGGGRVARMRPQPMVDMAHAIHVEGVEQDLLLGHDGRSSRLLAGAGATAGPGGSGMQPIAARVGAEERIAHALMRGRHKARAYRHH